MINISNEQDQHQSRDEVLGILADMIPADSRQAYIIQLVNHLCDKIDELSGQVELRERENELLASALDQSFEEANLLHKVGDMISIKQKPADYLCNICSDLLDVVACEHIVIFWYDHNHDSSEQEVRPAIYQEGRHRLAGITLDTIWQIALLAALDKRAFVIENNYGNGNISLPDTIKGFIITPILGDKGLLGALVAINKAASGAFSNIEARITLSVSNKLSVSHENQSLYIRQRELMLGTLCALVRSIDAKDPYTCGHSERVAWICRFLAENMALTDEQIENAYMTGLLHDIGKIGIRGTTLRKDDRLTDEEYDEIKKHPEIGAGILNGIKQISEVVSGVMTHHERYDGKGYPFGLSSNNIPLIGRIVNVADTFDAMISSRPYRQSLPINEVLYEISRFSGTQFDPKIADILLKADLEQLLARLNSTNNSSNTGPDIRPSLRNRACQTTSQSECSMAKQKEFNGYSE